MTRLTVKLEGEIIPPGGSVLVLASGGMDSSTLVALAKADAGSVEALFVNYEQACCSAEEAAARQISSALGCTLRVVRYRGGTFAAGEIRGRNAFLIHTALLEFPWRSGTVMIGIHAGTPYRDCSQNFLQLMQRSFDFHSGGAISLVAPFITWTKRDIHQLAVDLGVPFDKTYGCEVGNVPCGNCRSCRDRQALGLEPQRDRA